MPKFISTHEQLVKAVEKCKPAEWFKPGRIIKVNDKMQYGEYILTARYGRDFDPEFKPELTPKQMLELGVFEGKYLNDCVLEYPREWFTRRALRHMSPEKPNINLNYYKIKSRLSLAEWRRRGWIGFKVTIEDKEVVDQNVRGWFQWYCRYYIGYRVAGIDEVQIKRWKSFRRHAGQIIKHCKSKSHKKINGACSKQEVCRPRQRQALLQWAYDPRKL